ncbi:MAG: acetate--CoA ligase family protein [Syntrophales bacterium]
MEKWKLQRIKEALYPTSVAVLGVSDAANNLGTQVVDALMVEGFPGAIYPVHPRLKTLLGLKVYSTLEEIGHPVDLVISGLNAKLTTESVIESCARIGVKGIVCFAGGFKEVGSEGLRYEKKLKEVADKYQIIIFGPNILGVINNNQRLYATFWSFKKGNPLGSVSIVSQSGGTACTMLNDLIDRHVGVNKWVCLGNRTNLEFSDMFYYFADDDDTRVVAAFVEGIEDGRGFMEAARTLSQKKPLVVLKGARSELVSAAAASHTGTMGGTYRIFKDACRQYKILEVENSKDLATVCKALAIAPRPIGTRVAVLTHTAGPSILALDTLIENGCPLARASEQTLIRIKKIIGEHVPIVLAPNPIDITGSGTFVDVYPKCVEAVSEDDGVDIVMPIYAIHRNFETPARALAELKRRTSKSIVVCILASRDEMSEDERIMQEAGIPVFQAPEDASIAASYLARYNDYMLQGGGNEHN